MEKATTREGFSEKIEQVIPKARRFRKESMKRHTTFRVGGPADWYLQVESVGELQEVIAVCKEYQVEWQVLGNGSNVLVSDQGYRGVICRLTGPEFEAVKVVDDFSTGIGTVTAGAGALMSKLAMTVGKKGFTGLEFAGGIPGTVGGGVWMNAGAYGGEISQVLVSALLLTKNGELRQVTKEELGLSYRHSVLQETGEIVLQAVFELKVLPKLQIFVVMESLKKARFAKQPLEYPSAGSTFKRPEGYFAGKLIQDAGLSGCRIGGAEVSTKHAGFLINTGTATATDLVHLIRHVQQTVKEKYGVQLEPEVRFLGSFDTEEWRNQ